MFEPFRYTSPTKAETFILQRRHPLRGHNPTIRDPTPEF
jgi:hypothetical protein